MSFRWAIIYSDQSTFYRQIFASAWPLVRPYRTLLHPHRLYTWRNTLNTASTTEPTNMENCMLLFTSHHSTRCNPGALLPFQPVNSPFGGAGPPGTSETRAFVNRLKQLSFLRGCDNVTEFVGAVLDDSRSHLRSFLTEALPLPSLYWMFAGAEKRKEWIPWSIRELWTKQLVGAVSYVHARGIIVGGFGTRSGIGIRTNGSVFLDPSICNPGYHTDAYGKLPPELRKRPGKRLSSKTFASFRMDLFYLGMALWIIAKHRPDFIGCFCALNVCTNCPRYSCTASHSNPIELPCLSNTEVPKYFDSIINHCRQSGPSARLPARLLLQYFDCQPLTSEVAKL